MPVAALSAARFYIFCVTSELKCHIKNLPLNGIAPDGSDILAPVIPVSSREYRREFIRGDDALVFTVRYKFVEITPRFLHGIFRRILLPELEATQDQRGNIRCRLIVWNARNGVIVS